MRDYCLVAGQPRELDRVERLGQRSDLVQLDQDRVRDVLLDAAAQELGVRHEDVITDKLDAAAEPFGERRPSLPFILRKPILERDDREPGAEPFEQLDHPFGVELPAFAPQS